MLAAGLIHAQQDLQNDEWVVSLVYMPRLSHGCTWKGEDSWIGGSMVGWWCRQCLWLTILGWKDGSMADRGISVWMEAERKKKMNPIGGSKKERWGSQVRNLSWVGNPEIKVGRRSIEQKIPPKKIFNIEYWFKYSLGGIESQVFVKSSWWRWLRGVGMGLEGGGSWSWLEFWSVWSSLLIIWVGLGSNSTGFKATSLQAIERLSS